MKEKNPRGLLVFWSTYYLVLTYLFVFYFFREIENMKNTICFVKSWYKIHSSKEILKSFDLNRKLPFV